MFMAKRNCFARALNELKCLSFWRDVSVEFIATCILLTVQCSVVLRWEEEKAPLLFGNIVQQGMTMGFVVGATSWAFGDFGGCFMNPAVTVAMAVKGEITIIRGCLYIIAQCCGAMTGSGFTYSVTPASLRENLSATTLHPEMTSWQGFCVEAWLTFILVCIIQGSTNVKRKGNVYMPTIIIGSYVSVAVMTGSAQTGASMNPARSLGPAVIMGIWKDHWIYWAGPISGGLLSILVYYLLDKVSSRQLSKDPDKMDVPEVVVQKEHSVLLNDRNKTSETSIT